ncbi:hypothetical protein BOTBODRAFT_246015 [Botryobasidium botryosum FD-172 SS1]|uniref:Protein kinase domain-containing protein n=1 Tax=Botryobasidium botryosum (strain FD-172 SS1) TaxID=930990 RepID=A0A067M4Q7_BOTB1|nr:hypothetical protein BOTBODRAFT_246015 [Botryobasidium botryosum FD-172 SS1]
MALQEDVGANNGPLSCYNMQARMLGQGGFGDCYTGKFFGRLISPQHHSLLGLLSINDLPHLMSPFMQNGVADDFVKRNPNANRVQLLVQIAQGLEYMHTRDPTIIHGDLKANNILISKNGSACLSDFGLSREHVEPSSEVNLGMSTQWAGWFNPCPLSNGLLNIGYAAANNKQLLTGGIPFPGLADGVIIQHILTSRYDRPTNSDAVACGLNDEMWALILECWDRDSLERPSVSQVVERFRRMPEPTSVNPSWKPCVTARGRGGEGSSPGMSISSGATGFGGDLFNLARLPQAFANDPFDEPGTSTKPRTTHLCMGHNIGPSY